MTGLEEYALLAVKMTDADLLLDARQPYDAEIAAIARAELEKRGVPW